MNCDDVFDRITSGGADAESDPAVETHLARCARCRSLVEALTPALELFREAEVEEGASAGESFAPHSEGLPHPRGAVRRHVRGEPLSPRDRDGISHGTLLRMAAAVVLGVALGGALSGMGRLDAGRESAPALGTRGDLLPDGVAGRRTLSAGLADVGALGIAAACLERTLPDLSQEPLPAAVPTQVAMADLVCCSNCHSSLVGQIDHGAGALSRVARSCAMCHN